MNCETFRGWVARAVRDDLPVDWPGEVFLEHLAGCATCQILLEAEEVSEAIGRLSEAEPTRREDLTVWDSLRTAIRRRELRRRVAGATASAALLVAVAFGSTRLSPRSADGPSTGVTARAAPVDVVELGRSLSTPDFVCWKAVVVPADGGSVLLCFDRKDPGQSQYEFARRVVLEAGFREKYPDLRMLTVSVTQDRKALFMVQAEREVLDELRSGRPAPEGMKFFRALRIINDVEGRTEEPGGER